MEGDRCSAVELLRASEKMTRLSDTEIPSFSAQIQLAETNYILFPRVILEASGRKVTLFQDFI